MPCHERSHPMEGLFRSTHPSPHTQSINIWPTEQQMSKKFLRDSCYWLKGHFFSKPLQTFHEPKSENLAQTLYDVYSDHVQVKNAVCTLIIIFSLFSALALKVLKKTIKEQVSVQGRIYWHLLLIYGPSLCSLSGLCQSLFLLYTSRGAPHAATERQSPSVYKLFVR